jgi:uncharacterized protein
MAPSPVPTDQRITAIDALRGAALFGILVANMRGFYAPAPVYFTPEVIHSRPVDIAVQAAIGTLVSGKFITIFAFLFGLGFAIQMERVNAVTYARRLGVLAVFGLLHASLLWSGDVLFNYALLGLPLLLFRRTGPKWLFRWGALLFLNTALLGLAGLVAVHLGVEIPRSPPPAPDVLAEHVRIFSQGSWMEIFRRRWADFVQIHASLPFSGPHLLGNLLLGAWVWKRGWLSDIDSHAERLRAVRKWGLLIGLPAVVAITAIAKVYHVRLLPPSIPGFGMLLLMSFGIPCLSAFYSTTVLLAHQGGAAWTRPFAAVGRMALTNYLMQSLICTTIFYSYGGALFGKVGPVGGLALTVLVFGLQIPLSGWWLRTHRYGPMEWLWRWLTYGGAHLRTRMAG